MKPGYVYIVGNANHSTLYTGVTSELPQRIWKHKQKQIEGFTKQHNCTYLYYYQYFPEISIAITEEKRIKGGSRKRKEALVTSMNPEWRDLYEEVSKLYSG